ncbi:MAG: hydrogenase maturation protease [Actinomycetota bacterium]|nr:hydrogenase maturation protease [Actinomycetota bacterium]
MIGFGNIFMSDDAIGIKVLDKLGPLPAGVEVIDGGTSAADLIAYAKESEKLIIIDAVDAGQATGEVLKFRLADIGHFVKKVKSYSLHDFGLAEALSLIEKLNISAEIIIIGIKPKNISFGEELSEEVEEKIPEIKNMVLEEIPD